MADVVYAEWNWSEDQTKEEMEYALDLIKEMVGKINKKEQVEPIDIPALVEERFHGRSVEKAKDETTITIDSTSESRWNPVLIELEKFAKRVEEKDYIVLSDLTSWLEPINEVLGTDLKYRREGMRINR
ncbi:hypothetical protein [Listeria phage LP-KV022]|uniref:Uncharacterized protein n=7 Tax=Homburgvirus TaxID=1921125 RepID=A0A6C0R024_9CAUD|nr:hypothetical protein P70_00119 [Listeria phage P70]YP_008240424.1 hypothetical protein LP110_060 [Listeria phage LP-110]YP_008240566.1 hypothetical protein LP037_088 [Listeria phage LP-037]YP_009045151.1 hypothetical protein LP114_097 [Listeria phage LP-114]AWY07753.1 hypothetical protein [Listeria phage LP-KV022]QDK04840.1 hypothetical protein FK484_0107 [Listeria phage LP-031]QHZ59449.1 hypothetical protein FK483_0106 [Listeria phage LP-018]AFQ96308.1 hypothetical protein P70_00119 [Lis